MKNIINSLIKVANNLDSLGYMEEANIVDRVAKKIVVSANPDFITRVSLDEAARLKFTGVYADDIYSYKKLSFLYHKLNRENKLNDMRLIGAYKNSLLDAVKKSKKWYDEEKNAFLAQADRIDNDHIRGLNALEINETMGDKSTVSLNEYLAKYNIVDYNGNLYDDITDQATFNSRWNQFLRDPIVIKQRKKYPGYFRTQLNNTYKILAASLKYLSD